MLYKMPLFYCSEGREEKSGILKRNVIAIFLHKQNTIIFIKNILTYSFSESEMSFLVNAYYKSSAI